MRPSVRSTSSRRAAAKRAAAAAAGLAAAAALLAAGGSAAAAPAPTVASVQARISAIDTQASKLGQQYDQSKVSLAAARRRLVLLNRSEARYRAHFTSLRAQVGRIAATAYEDGSLTSPTALLTSGQPQQVLNQSSILGEMSATNGTQIRQFLAAARQLTGAQQAAKRTETGIAQLEKSLGARYRKLGTLKGQQETLLAQLTPAQRQQAEPGGGSTSGGSTTSGSTPPKQSKVPASGQAAAAMAYAYTKIGDPYVWGATGPNEFDCSGLMMASWAAAGVSIPRTSYEQMGSLPAVPLNDLQPGDILGFDDNNHVGMYVGDGYLIDAPVPGAYVEKVPLSGWYAANLDGAVRP